MITILSARWANAERTAAVVTSQERGDIAISATDRPEEWADFQAWSSAGNTVSPLPEPSAAQQRETAIVADASRADLLSRLQTATLAQIDTYVDNNVTNIAGARVIFKALLKVLALNVQR